MVLYSCSLTHAPTRLDGRYVLVFLMFDVDGGCQLETTERRIGFRAQGLCALARWHWPFDCLA